MKISWINNSYIQCEDCDTIFKTNYLDKTKDVKFCPNCSSNNLNNFDDNSELDM